MRPVRIEAPGALAGSHRRFKFVTVPARLNEAGEQVRIVSPEARTAQQPPHRLRAAALITLDCGVQIVRDCQVRIERECPTERWPCRSTGTRPRAQ